MTKSSNLRYVKKTNALFLGFILLFLVTELLIAVISIMDVNISIVPTLFVSQGIILVPSLIFIVCERVELSEWVPFKKIKWSTFWLTILFTICISPFISFINVLSQLFTTNIVAELSGEFLAVSPLALLFIVGFFGPFCEEFTFRGVIYHGLGMSGRIPAAILVSALFFGLMHMNLNQFSYAFVLGLAFGLINEATGSILPSLIMHILINSVNVGMQYIADFAMTASGEAPEGLAGALSELDTGTDDILLVAGMLLIPALIGLVLSIVVFITICKNEGSLARMQSMFKPGKHSPSQEGSMPPEERSISPDEGTTSMEEGSISPEEGATSSVEGSTSPEEETMSSDEGTMSLGEGTASSAEGSTYSEDGATFSEERSTSPEGAAALSASGQETISETAPVAGASVKEAKCPVITATGWIAIGICVMVIVASDLLSNVFDML